MTNQYDAIVIGAGHNGLICSALLAKKGKKVLVLEANDQVGGAAITRKFADDFSVSACAHLLFQLQPDVQKDLGIEPDYSKKSLETIVLTDDGNHIRYQGKNITGVNEEDEKNYIEFHDRMVRFSDLLKTYLNKRPPRLGTKNTKDLMTLAKLGFDIRRMGKTEMREFLRLIGMNIYDELDERFVNPYLKGALSTDAVLGTHLGPRSPNTILTYLYRLAGSHGDVSSIQGGMGGLMNQLSSIAKGAGVEIKTNSKVNEISVSNGAVIGVQTEGGEKYISSIVVSNADPKQTMMNLVGPKHLEIRFTHRIDNIRMRGNASKLHFALNALPKISGFEDLDYQQRILIAPSEHYVEKAFNHAKYGESSVKPVLEITFPSTTDSSLAPEGKHVMSIVAQYAPYNLKAGWSNESKQQFSDAVKSVLKSHMANIDQCIISEELLTPADIEQEFNITGGHWHHGEFTLDQFMFVRPVAGSSQYEMPINGLFLCGAGSHPGGGISGACGRNAAQVILEKEE